MQSIVIKAMSHSCSILISKLLMLAYLDDINDDDDILCKAYIIYKLMNQCKMPHLRVSQTSHSETISELVTCQDGGDLWIEFLWYWSNPGSLLILASYMFEISPVCSCCFCCCSISVSGNSLWPYGHTPSGYSVHGIIQARILECNAISFSRGSAWSRDQTHVYWLVDGFFLTLSHLGSPNNYIKQSIWWKYVKKIIDHTKFAYSWTK